MNFDEEELLEASQKLVELVGQEEFESLEHHFVKSYITDYEYTEKHKKIFMKCDNDLLLVEMVFYDMNRKHTTNTFAFHFTQCTAYFTWLEHLTKLHFTETLFCKERYGKIKIRSESQNEIEAKIAQILSHGEDFHWV